MSNTPNEQEIIDRIPENWEASVREKLDAMIDMVSQGFTRMIAEDLKVDPNNANKFWEKLGKKTGVTETQAKLNFARTCLENAKLEVFRQNYGDILPIDEEGKTMLSPAILAKIFGDTDATVKTAFDKNSEQ
ncbi:MAG: hypothetical protein ACI86H_002582 [bacterium]|jgi:hypothetical protein